MGLFEQFPYTNFHELNLDWLLQQMKELDINFENLKTDIFEDVEGLVQEAVDAGLINIIYDASSQTIKLTAGTGIDQGRLVSFFQVASEKYAVADQTARSGVSTNAGNIANMNSQIGNLTPRVSALETKTADITNELIQNNVFFGTVVCIGDSYLAGWTPDGDFTSWGVYLAGLLGKTVGDDFRIYSQGGAGFVNTVDGRNFVNMLDEAAADLSAVADRVGLVIVGGGFNDQYAAYNDILVRIAQFKSAMTARFPNATGFIADMAWSQQAAAYRSTAYNKAKVMRAYEIGALNNGLQSFSTCWRALIGVDPAGGKYLASDDVHPIEAGHRSLARAIFSVLRTGYYSEPDYKILEPVNATWLFAIISGGYVKAFSTTQSPNLGTSVLNQESGLLNGNAVYVTLPAIAGFEPVTDMKIWGTARIQIHTSAGYKTVDGLAGIAGGQIRIYLYALNDAGNNYYQANAIDEIQIMNMSLNVPTIFS